MTMLQALLLAATIAAAPIPLDSAKRAFEEARLAAGEDGGKLWGVSLDGPMIFVDPQTRFAVANRADGGGKLVASDGVFAGTLPADVVIANTATSWSGTRWTMVMWDSVASRTVPRRRLLLHESFHRVQDAVGFPPANVVSEHLDTLDGRYWFLLELRALAAALRATGEARTSAIGDALAFRAKRRSLFPDAASKERALENNEGLAEYTGWALRGTSDTESRMTFAQSILSVDPGTTFARSFAYRTGPAYGLLLDTLSPGWTRRYHASDDLAAFTDVKAAADAEAAAARYDGVNLRAEEVKRDAELQRKIAHYRALLVEGPVIELPMEEAHYAFDPNTVTTIPGAGTVFPTLDVTAAWGTLHAPDGALIPPDFTRIVVPASTRTSGLKLENGWKLIEGSRPGDYRVTR